MLGPYVPLAAKLGRLAMELADGKADEIVLTAYGGLAEYDTRLLTVAALNGAFQGRADRPVNYVNAPLIARERGIEVREERSQSARDYTNLLRVEIKAGKLRVRVAGTTIGRDHRQWLVHALGFDLELELAPLFVVFRYDDVPGVIGRVGTLFGEAGVNIANMTVSRTRRGGKALMVLTVDERPPRRARRADPGRGLRRRPCARARPRNGLEACTLGRWRRGRSRWNGSPRFCAAPAWTGAWRSSPRGRRRRPPPPRRSAARPARS